MSARRQVNVVGRERGALGVGAVADDGRSTLDTRAPSRAPCTDPAGGCPPAAADYANDDFGMWLWERFASRYAKDHYAYAIETLSVDTFAQCSMSVRSSRRSRLSMHTRGY